MEKFKTEDNVLVWYEGEDETVRVPEGVEYISTTAFWINNGFKKLVLPASLSRFNAAAFDFCKNIDEIEISADNPIYYAKQNCLIERDSATLILGACKSKIPADGSVKTIGSHAFGGTSHCCVFIPACIERVEEEAFLMNYQLYINVEAEEEPDSWSEDWCPTGVTPENICWEEGDPDILILFGCKPDED